MKLAPHILLVSLLLVIGGCTKVETVSVNCDNTLKANTPNITVNYRDSAAVTLEAYFEYGDSIEVIKPNGTHQFFELTSSTNSFVYDFRSYTSSDAGEYTFIHRLSTPNQYCSYVSTKVRLTLQGTQGSSCRPALVNLLYQSNGLSSSITENYSTPDLYYNSNYDKAYYYNFLGSTREVELYFLNNAKPKPGEVFYITSYVNNPSPSPDNVIVLVDNYYCSQGMVFCTTENNVNYITICDGKVGNSYYSARVQVQ